MLLGGLLKRNQLVGWFEVFEQPADTEGPGAARTLQQARRSFLNADGTVRDTRTSDAVLELQGMPKPGGCRILPIAQGLTVNGRPLQSPKMLALKDIIEVPQPQGPPLRLIYYRDLPADR